MQNRSTTSYDFLFSNGPISWCSQRQRLVSLSTTEAEYIAASTATRELVWLKQLLSDIGYQCDEPIRLEIDHQSTIKLVKNPELHKRSKHIDIHYHFIREKYHSKELDVKYVPSEEQCADFLTKAVACSKFMYLIDKIGMCMIK